MTAVAVNYRVKTTKDEIPLVPKFTTLVGKGYAGDITRYSRTVSRRVGVIKEDWSDDVLSAQGFNLDEGFARSKYEPSSLFTALENYDGPSTWEFKNEQDWRVLMRAVSKVESYFKDFYGTLDPLPLDEGLANSIKPNTSSGLPELLPKKLVFADALLRAKDVLDLEHRAATGEKVTIRREPSVAYYRTQTSINGGKPKQKVRLVWGLPLDQILLEACYAVPAIELTKTAVTPITLGYRKSELGALMSSTEWAPVAGTFDWSKWDAFCPTRLILEAFRILKKFFRNVDEVHWELLLRYFCTGGILMPDGKVYNRRKRGIPSGSFFTSIIGSIANMIAIHFLSFLQDVDVIGIFVLGDDSFALFTKAINVGSMVKSAKYHFGMKLNLDKIVYGGGNVSPHYLGHDWVKGRIHRPLVETVQRIQYPERYNREWYTDRYNKIISLYGDNAGSWPLIVKILKRKGLATLLGSGEQFLLKSFIDLAGFTMTESPEKRAQRSRISLATLK
jgi:hypothetical protein